MPRGLQATAGRQHSQRSYVDRKWLAKAVGNRDVLIAIRSVLRSIRFNPRSENWSDAYAHGV